MRLSEAEKLFYKAHLSFEEGRIIESADLFSTITERFPDFGKAYNYLGLIYFYNLKDPQKAEENFKNAISSSPEFPDSYLHYAALLLSQDRFAEMNANLNKVSAIPGSELDKVHELFGKMNERMGKYEEAMEYYKKAIIYTFSEEDMALYEKGISRCKIKKNYL